MPPFDSFEYGYQSPAPPPVRPVPSSQIVLSTFYDTACTQPKSIYTFRLLAASSDKIRVSEYGRSAEGRPLIVATIAAPETLRNLDRYREIQRRLADPRLTTPAQAEPMFKAGKNIVLLTCSIHANEVASTHSAVEFAYRLITESNPRFENILNNTICCWCRR